MYNIQMNSLLTSVLRETSKQVLPDQEKFMDIFCSIAKATGMPAAESAWSLVEMNG